MIIRKLSSENLDACSCCFKLKEIMENQGFAGVAVEKHLKKACVIDPALGNRRCPLTFWFILWKSKNLVIFTTCQRSMWPEQHSFLASILSMSSGSNVATKLSIKMIEFDAFSASNCHFESAQDLYQNVLKSLLKFRSHCPLESSGLKNLWP